MKERAVDSINPSDSLSYSDIVVHLLDETIGGEGTARIAIYHDKARGEHLGRHRRSQRFAPPQL